MHLKFFHSDHISFIRIPVFIGHKLIAVLQCVREGKKRILTCSNNKLHQPMLEE